MSKEGGYIKLYRSLFDHPLFNEKDVVASRRSAMIDLIRWTWYAHDKPGTRLIRNKMIRYQRGTFPASLRWLAEEWGWSKTRVDNFLKQLQDEGTIKIGTVEGTDQNLITLCNYEHYNPISEYNGTPNGTPEGHSEDTQRTPEGHPKDKYNNSNKVNTGKEGDDAQALSPTDEKSYVSDPPSVTAAPPPPNPRSAAPLSSPPPEQKAKKPDGRVPFFEAAWALCGATYGDDTKELWAKLCETKYWKRKEFVSIVSNLNDVLKYDEGFAQSQIKKAINGGWRALVFGADTDKQYEDWKESNARQQGSAAGNGAAANRVSDSYIEDSQKDEEFYGKLG